MFRSYIRRLPGPFLASVVIFILALAIRIYGFYILDAPGIIAERQFRSALIARSYYFQMASFIPEWRLQIAEVSQERAGVLEPPLFELLVAFIYRLVSGEHLWIARLLSSLFWMVGGVFLYQIAKRMVSAEAAVFTTAYYLFVPLGVVVSISFLPEPLMVMFLLFSLFTILRYYDRPSKTRLVTASVISGLAVLVKPFILFIVLGAFISQWIYKRATGKRIIDFDLLVYLGICLSPSASYYLYGIFISKEMSANFQAGFLPYLFFTQEFWKGWLLTAAGAVGYTPLLAGLLGLSMVPRAASRALLIGLWIGYLLFGMAYTYPIPISGHYHLQLMIIVALSIAPIIKLISDHLRQTTTRWYWWLPVLGSLSLAVLFNIRDIRTELASYRQFENKETAQEIGEKVNHSSQTIYVASYYGMPLEYYGELSGVYWPRRAVNWDLVKDRFRGLVDQPETHPIIKMRNWIFRRLDERTLSVADRFTILGFSPEYFIISDFEEFNRNHVDLREFLANNCPLLAESDKYLIYEVKACAK